MTLPRANRRLISWAAIGLLTLAWIGLLLGTLPMLAQGGEQDEAPATPDKPAGEAVYQGMVDLEWKDTPEAESYEVQIFQNEWFTLPGKSIEIAFYGAGAIVRNLDPEDLYYFRVRARNSAGSSEWSDYLQLPGTSTQDWDDVPEPTSSPATGAPAISGIAQVGEDLTASTLAIEDENGLDRVKFSYQWASSDGNTEMDIEGATESAHTLTTADEGKTIRVRVTFTDRGGHAESLTSAETEAVTNNDSASNTPATGLPTISGTAQVGETLTADTSGIDDADGLDNVAFSYQWIASDADTAGATGDSYTLVEADVGKTLRVRVTFTDRGGYAESLTSEATQAVTNNDSVSNTPATGLPTISGTAQVGETLTADTSGIDDADGLDNVAFSYQWIASDADTAGATGDSYTLVEADVGKTLRVRVTFTDRGGYAESLTSEATAAVAAAPTPLTAGFEDVPESHSGEDAFTFRIAFSEPISISYKTLRDHSLEVTNGSVTKVKRVNGSSDLWEITVDPDSDGDVTITLPVTDDCTAQGAVCTGDGTKLSNRLELTVPQEEDRNSPATGAPTISGTARVGEELTADTSGIADADGLDHATFGYQWLADDADIAGATGSSYTLVDADGGKTIKVRVSFTDDGDNEESLTSEATARTNSPSTGQPTISGTAQVGETLTAHTSGINDADGLDNATFSYQWLADDADIAGATGSSYTLVAADEGKTIKVRVSFTDDDGNEETLTGATATSLPLPAPEDPPNIVLIFVDDLGYKDVSFNGATEIQTTNIDRLANEGIVFNSGYVTYPTCSPSRAGLLTGRYQSRFGLEGNLAYMPFDKGLGMPLEETTFPTYLQEAGYRTGIVGKWQLGAAHHFTPLKRGFDYFFGFLGGGHDYWNIDASNPGSEYSVPLVENKSTATFTGYLTDALTNKAIEFMEEEQDDPFFLYLAYNAPHDPYQAPSELVQKYRNIGDSDRRTYLAMVDSLDQNVGRVLEALEQSDQRDNTIVFFLSDNGGTQAGDNGPLRGGKGKFYEGGIRVPFVASWPARWPQGETYEPMVISLDIAATALEMAGATVTDDTRPLDGVNLDPFLRGEEVAPPHEALFWRHWRTGGYAVRSGNMKLVKERTGEPMLFDLDDDIGETRDLLTSDAETASELASLWNEWNLDNSSGSLFYGIGEYKDRLREFTEEYAASKLKAADEAPLHQIEEFTSGE